MTQREQFDKKQSSGRTPNLAKSLRDLAIIYDYQDRPLLKRAAERIEELEKERDELKHDMERGMANHNADLNPIPSSKAPITVGPLVRGEAGDWIDAVALDIAELGDRTSPDDQPEMMLVTADELRRFILANVPCAPSAIGSLPAAVTQCFTAGTVSSTSEGVRLVCCQCGNEHLEPMLRFEYDLHPHADYPTEHPDRCRLLDGTYYDPPIIEDGHSRLHWRCHKKAGHDSANGGRHCSTHRDCGARVEIEPDLHGTCGKEPGHDGGVHEQFDIKQPSQEKPNG